MSEGTGSVWGYHPVLGGRIFADGKLPDGWRDRPHRGQHPHDVELGIAPSGASEGGAGEGMAKAPQRPGPAVGAEPLERDEIPLAKKEPAMKDMATKEMAMKEMAMTNPSSGDDTAPQQRGRFRKGQSGNPAGRPGGARNQTTLAMEALLDEDAKAIMRTAIDKAKGGDSTALRLCLDRLAPVRRDRCISFALPAITAAADASAAAAAIVAGVACGDLTASEAADLGKLVESYVRTLEAAEFDARLRKLEEEKPGQDMRR